MSGFLEAVSEVSERVDAVASPDPEKDVSTVYGDPRAMIRAVLSGYVDDTDDALAFLDEYAAATMRALWQAAGPESARAAVKFSASQLIAIGVAAGRRGA